MRRVVIFTDYTLQDMVSHQNLHTIVISLNVLITEKSKTLRIENNFGKIGKKDVSSNTNNVMKRFLPGCYFFILQIWYMFKGGPENL